MIRVQSDFTFCAEDVLDFHGVVPFTFLPDIVMHPRAAFIALAVAALASGACTESTPTETRPGGSVLGDGMLSCDGFEISACTDIGGGGWTGGGPGGGDGEGITKPGPGGGECMASAGWDAQAVQGCNEGGDGPEPDEGSILMNDQTHADTIPRNCADPGLTSWQLIYCRSTIPEGTRRTKIQQALDRIAARGEECAALAQRGRDMLARGGIRVFEWRPGDAGGFGDPDTDIQIGSGVLDRYDPASSAPQDFEHVLVHELDHTLGLPHIDDAGWHTAHTAACGGGA